MRICLQVTFINEYNDAALNRMQGRNSEHEKASTSPDFFSVTWLCGNGKREHCSHALSSENWPCSRNIVKCWTGASRLTQQGWAQPAQLQAHLRMLLSAVLNSHLLTGSWGVVSETPSQTCWRCWNRVSELRMERRHHSPCVWCPSGMVENRR